MRKRIDRLVKDAKRIIVAGHLSPDPDALASALGVWFYLRKQYPQKEAQIVFEGEACRQGRFLPGFAKIKWVANLAEELKEADLAILLDGSEYSRFTTNGKAFARTGLKTICLDHHPQTPDKFSVLIQDQQAAAVTQMVGEIFYTSDDLIDADVATILVAGIISDTGNFRFVDPARARVFTEVKRLVEIGRVNLQTVSLKLNEVTLATFNLIKELYQNIRQESWSGSPPVSYSFLPPETLKQFPLSDIAGAVHHFLDTPLRQYPGFVWGFVLSPGLAGYNLNFRSTPGGPNVQKIAAIFGGGGHLLAAAGRYLSASSNGLTLCRRVMKKISQAGVELTQK